MNMEDCERSSRVLGYHIYKAISNSVTSEELRFEREPDTNQSNRYAVTVKRWDNHRSSAREISRACSLFLRTGNEVMCCVIAWFH